MHQSYFVYVLESQFTSKRYIGVTSNPKRRLKEHRKKARYNSQCPIHCAMRKYGVTSFVMNVLLGSKDRDYIFNEAESLFIQEYDTLAPHGYNIMSGGQGGGGENHAKNMRGMWASKSSAEMIAFKTKMKAVGADISDETRQLRSEAAKQQHADPKKKATHKAAASKANQDPEKRKRIADAAKARWADPEFKAKMKIRFATRCGA